MKQKLYFYYAYGLTIKSPIILDGLISKEKKPDITIYFNNIQPKTVSLKEYKISKNIKITRALKTIYFFWKDILICEIKNIDEIVINDSIGFDESFLQNIILGFSLPIILQQRGMLILHANAIEINGNAAIFIGNRGIGKSTTSLALLKNENNLISDDITCINLKSDSINVIPGFPKIKVFSEVIKAIGENPNKMPKINSQIEKCVYSPDRFVMNSIPLANIYLIERSVNDSVIVSLSNKRAVIELVKSTMWATIFTKKELHENLLQCVSVTKKIPVKLLNVKESLNDLQHLTELIENDLNV